MLSLIISQNFYKRDFKNILIFSKSVKICKSYKPKRTLFTSLAFTLNPKRANVGPVSFVIWSSPCQLQQEVICSLRFSNCSSCRSSICVSKLKIKWHVSNTTLNSAIPKPKWNCTTRAWKTIEIMRNAKNS